MNIAVQLFNQLMSVLGKSHCWIEEKQCDDTDELLKEFEKSWTYTRTLFNITSNLGAKHHSLSDCVEYIKLWKIGIRYVSEQSIEGFHKTCSLAFSRYRNQRCLLRMKIALH